MIRVLVSAASEDVRADLESLIAGSPSMALVGGAARFDDLMDQIEDLKPDVLLIEADLDEQEDIQTLAAMAGGTEEGEDQNTGRGQGRPQVVVLTDDAAAWTAGRLGSGIAAILPRNATAREILASIEAVAAGLLVLHPASAAQYRVDQGDGPASQPGTKPDESIDDGLYEPVTPRELEVLRMLAEGLGNKQIASRLGISEHTVKFHVASIFGKLGASSRTEAVARGLRMGLITL